MHNNGRDLDKLNVKQPFQQTGFLRNIDIEKMELNGHFELNIQ